MSMADIIIGIALTWIIFSTVLRHVREMNTAIEAQHEGPSE